MDDEIKNRFDALEADNAKLRAALDEVSNRRVELPSDLVRHSDIANIARHSDLERFANDTREHVENNRGSVLTASDRAVLDHAASFFNIHTTVAETLASRENGVTDIDPNTGKERVIVEKPVAFQNVEQPSNGI